jgi:mono/diheme cytochrome c family protein
MCHGAGKGELASQMKLTLSDMNDPATLKDKTDEQLYGTIRDGKEKMPAEGDRMNAQDGWSLVAYVRSLSDGKAKAAVGDQPKE